MISDMKWSLICRSHPFCRGFRYQYWHTECNGGVVRTRWDQRKRSRAGNTLEPQPRSSSSQREWKQQNWKGKFNLAFFQRNLAIFSSDWIETLLTRVHLTGFFLFDATLAKTISRKNWIWNVAGKSGAPVWICCSYFLGWEISNGCQSMEIFLVIISLVV